jgi:hypothetical protein
MEFDVDDRVIVGRVLDIDDIVTFHGESASRLNRLRTAKPAGTAPR